MQQITISSLLIALSLLPSCTLERPASPLTTTVAKTQPLAQPKRLTDATTNLNKTIPENNGQLPIPPGQHEQTIAAATVSCEKSDAANCPSSVGMLITKGDKTLGECTAFLIDAQTVVTNSHCLPPTLRHAGRLCDSSIQILFPQAGGFAAERATCREVIQATQLSQDSSGRLSKNSGETADYALLRLAHPTQRKPLVLSRAGLNDGLQLKTFAIDPTSKTALNGVLRVKNCTATQGSLLVPSFTQSDAPVGVFDHCDILPGNSGSPAVDSEGRVRAVVQATLRARNKRNSAGEMQTFDNMALMSNLACAAFPENISVEHKKPAANCGLKSSPAELLRTARRSIDEDELAPLILQWSKKSPSNLQFQTAPPAGEEGNHILAPILECIKTLPDMNLTKVRFEMPYWGFTADLDPAYRIKMRASKIEDFEVSVSFDARTLQNNGRVTAHVHRISRSKSEQSFAADSTMKIEMCPFVGKQAAK